MTASLHIDLLRTFHTVVRIGKFSAAAALLHKSPAAISTHIQRLEAVAGGQLLQRDNQSVRLTALGKRLLHSTAELLRAHDRALADLRGTDFVGRVALGVPDEYATQVIEEILPTFSHAWPNVVLELKLGPSNQLKAWTQREEVQVAVIVQPQDEPYPDAQLLMATTPVWVGAAHRRVAPEDPLPLAVYAEPCVYRRAMAASLDASGRRSRIVLESHSSQAVKACVEAGLAISLIDRGKISRRMQILDEMPTIPDHHILLIRSAAARDDEIVALLAQTIQQMFRL